MKSYVEFAMQSHMNLHFGNQRNRADNPENKLMEMVFDLIQYGFMQKV